MDEIMKKNLKKLNDLAMKDFQKIYSEIIESLKKELSDDDLEKLLIKFYSVANIHNSLNHLRLNIGNPLDEKKARNPEKSS